MSTLASEGWLDKSTPTSPVAATESGGGLHEKKKKKKKRIARISGMETQPGRVVKGSLSSYFLSPFSNLGAVVGRFPRNLKLEHEYF